MACHMWQISWYRNCDFPIRKVLTFFNKFTHLSKCHGNLNTRPVINKNFNHSHRMKIVPCQKCILHTWHVTCHRQCWWNHWLCYNFLSKLLSVPPLPLNASSLPPHVNLLSCDSCFSHSWLMDSLRFLTSHIITMLNPQLWLMFTLPTHQWWLVIYMWLTLIYDSSF